LLTFVLLSASFNGRLDPKSCGGSASRGARSRSASYEDGQQDATLHHPAQWQGAELSLMRSNRRPIPQEQRGRLAATKARWLPSGCASRLPIRCVFGGMQQGLIATTCSRPMVPPHLRGGCACWTPAVHSSWQLNLCWKYVRVRAGSKIMSTGQAGAGLP
jgi:hypothetical protein